MRVLTQTLVRDRTQHGKIGGRASGVQPNRTPGCAAEWLNWEVPIRQRKG